MKSLLILCLALSLYACGEAEAPTVYSQNPSPMVDYTRPHHRISLDAVPDAGDTIHLSEKVVSQLYVPDKWANETRLDLLIHFHGDARVAQHAVDRQPAPWIVFHCHWGNGSSAYSRPVDELGAGAWLEAVRAAVQEKLSGAAISGVYLSAWSAGYGAVRSIIGREEAASQVDGILLLDGLHCSYVPEGTPLAAGGALDSMQMEPFVRWAKWAAQGEKSLLLTHSAVFPGTYASTTETAEYLLQALGIPRQSLLAEGPVGMQQTSVAEKGKLQVISFAGNSAPDHVDHLHGLPVFLGWLQE